MRTEAHRLRRHDMSYIYILIGLIVAVSLLTGLALVVTMAIEWLEDRGGDK